MLQKSGLEDQIGSLTWLLKKPGQINWVGAAGLALVLANVLAISEKNESYRPRLAEMN